MKRLHPVSWNPSQCLMLNIARSLCTYSEGPGNRFISAYGFCRFLEGPNLLSCTSCTETTFQGGISHRSFDKGASESESKRAEFGHQSSKRLSRNLLSRSNQGKCFSQKKKTLKIVLV